MSSDCATSDCRQARDAVFFVARRNDDGKFDQLFRLGLVEDRAGSDRECQRHTRFIRESQDRFQGALPFDCFRFGSIRFVRHCAWPFASNPSLRIIRMCVFLVFYLRFPFG